MVLTRSQLASGSPRKPPTPRSKRKERQKTGNDSSSDDEGCLEMTGVKKSLAIQLEPISEEDETTATPPDSRKKGRWPSQSKRNKPRFQKTPLKIPLTIEEEATDDHLDETQEAVEPGKKNKSEPSKTDELVTDQVELDRKAEDFCVDTSAGTKGCSLERIDYVKTDNASECVQTSISPDASGTKKEMAAAKLKNRFYFPPPKTLVPVTAIETSINVGVDVPESYIDAKGTKEGRKKMEKLFAEAVISSKDSRVKDSIITPDFERASTSVCEKSKKQKWRERKIERDSTAGKEWYNLKPPEMTDDVKRDLKILQMRSVLDPKRFYKHNDRKALPKYFQVGRIMDNAADFYSSRVPKKQRKANLTEELLADAEFQRYQKRKYNEIQMQKKSRFLKKSKAKRLKFSSKSEDND